MNEMQGQREEYRSKGWGKAGEKQWEGRKNEHMSGWGGAQEMDGGERGQGCHAEVMIYRLYWNITNFNTYTYDFTYSNNQVVQECNISSWIKIIPFQLLRIAIQHLHLLPINLNSCALCSSTPNYLVTFVAVSDISVVFSDSNYDGVNLTFILFCAEQLIVFL